VATLGRIATAAIWPEMTPITRCHGVERLLWADQLHLPMLHPSYALRGTANLALFEQDVSVLASLIKELTE
jgi:uracil-DNA glycosylase